jgi:hypothetical protein
MVGDCGWIQHQTSEQQQPSSFPRAHRRAEAPFFASAITRKIQPINETGHA